MTTDKIIITYTDDDVSAVIHEAHDEYVIAWNDHVVNAWEERYDTLTDAVARLALLIAAVKQDRFFAQQPANFACDWAVLVERHLGVNR